MIARAAVAAAVLAAAAPAGAVEIRIATLAPSGSAWGRIMEGASASLALATSGRVRLRYYYSGLQGDERDVVRKMKLGQLDGAALSAIGLGLIDPEVLVLELPYLFTSEAELDRARAGITPELEAGFERAGYVLVSWGDLGWVHTYFTADLTGPADLARIRFWEWNDDPISREMFALLGLNAVPLGVPDVLPALQTGTIQACAGPPLAAIALQWHTKIKYMTDRPPSYAVGALVIRKAVLDQLAPADRELLVRGGRDVGARLIQSVRRDNERAKRAMIGAGVIPIHVPDDVQAKLVAAGQDVAQRLAGRLYPKELLDEVRRLRGATP
jgi:TRAP-type C4-dicarboxylate transport system substrate-binding protein